MAKPSIFQPKKACSYPVMITIASRTSGRRWQMDPNAHSVFNLTPPEKLQLVEDLWDDLAAIPSDVPVHEWQKEELARRKANLISKPASGLSWDQVKRRIRSRYGR
jgi:putative addiction module component (TIGR02574 family)